jgi:nucleoside-diphosphate-sugar epimerase
MVEIIERDAGRQTDLDAALVGITHVYHLARPVVKTWADYQEQDIEVTRLIAERCLAAGVKRLIYTGTIDSYYAGARAGTITEETPLDPRIEGRNLYARSKAHCEAILTAMHREGKLPVVIARPGIVIGRGGSPFHWGVGMWHHGAICRLWGDGNNPLPLVLVEDVAAGLVRLLDAPGVEGESFNFVADACLSAREYIAELERATGVKLNVQPTAIAKFYLTDMVKWMIKLLIRHPERRRPSYRDWESRTQRAVFDCSKAKRVLAWQPTSDRNEVVRRGIIEPVVEVQ